MTDLKTLQEEFREYFDKHLKPKRETMKNLDRELCVNTLERAFTLGMMKGVEMVEEVVPEDKFIKDYSHSPRFSYKDVTMPNHQGWNECRSEILSKIKNLKQELK